MEIQGARVIIREKRLEDAHSEFVWRSDPELAKLDATMPIDIRYEEFLRIFKGQLDYPTSWARRLSIETMDGLYIGNCMYYDIDSVTKEAEIGIMIGDRDYWSKGYGLDVMVTLVDYLFSSTSLNRFYLHTLQWNKRAQRCFSKSGFSPVKSVRRSGKDFIKMEILREVWGTIRDEKMAAREYLGRTETWPGVLES